MLPQQCIRIDEIDAKYQSLLMMFDERTLQIDAEGLYYKDLNCLLRQAICMDIDHIKILNVCGQRYIGTDLDSKVQIDIYGTPGNDLGAFMNGPKMVIHGVGTPDSARRGSGAGIGAIAIPIAQGCLQ